MENNPEIEQLKAQDDVRTALQQTAGTEESRERPLTETRDKIWFVIYSLVVIGLIVLFYLLRTDRLLIPQLDVPFLRRGVLGAILIVLTIALAQAIRISFISRINSRPSQFNLNRVLNLVVGLIITIILLSIFSANWYTALVSLGLLSLILGFALQTPITSFIGWIYLLTRQPYRVGDRIKIGDAKGDVIDVGYLDTTLWEVGGPYISTEHPSGRIIKFPNSLSLSETVFNYSWPLFPYVWDEIKFQVAYQSDLEFLAHTMQTIVSAELGEQMQDQVEIYRQLLRQTPVDKLEIQEKPVIHFRASENTWLEVIVRYLVHPKRAGQIKTQLIYKMLKALNAEPERVLFPQSNLR